MVVDAGDPMKRLNGPLSHHALTSPGSHLNRRRSGLFFILPALLQFEEIGRVMSILPRLPLGSVENLRAVPVLDLGNPFQ
jgi:hypothetical protein